MATKLTFILCLLGHLVLAQKGIIGKWQTIDDSSQETKSVVELFEREGKLVGRVLKIFPKPQEDPDPVCSKCPQDDTRHNEKIIGMEILQDMAKDGDSYSGGEILDPEVGKTYRCKIWLEEGDLKVRGYWGPFYRTQTWKRVQ